MTILLTEQISSHSIISIISAGLSSTKDCFKIWYTFIFPSYEYEYECAHVITGKPLPLNSNALGPNT